MSIYNILLTAMIFAVCAFLCGGVYCFLLILLKIPSSKTTRAIRSVGSRGRPTPVGYVQTYNNISLFVSKLLPMSEYRRQTMAANLKIAHISLPPELYEARALVKAAGYALLALPMYGMAALVTMSMSGELARIIPPVLAVMMVIVGVLQYTNSREKISEAIRQKREQIDMDLPRFVYAISQEIQMDHNVLAILEKHKNNFSEYFREELEITISDMRSSNWEAALTRFEGRIGHARAYRDGSRQRYAHLLGKSYDTLLGIPEAAA